jgi:hypothetical protein
LDKLDLLIFFIGILLWSNWVVIAKLGEEVIVKELLGLFPVETICISLANILSISVFEDVEKCLPDPRVFYN